MKCINGENASSIFKIQSKDSSTWKVQANEFSFKQVDATLQTEFKYLFEADPYRSIDINPAFDFVYMPPKDFLEVAQRLKT